MALMRRRRFLATAGAATAAFGGFLYPGASDAARQLRLGRSQTITPDPLGPDPTYAGGEVVSKTDNGVVLATPSTSRAVRIGKDDVVWKEIEGNSDLIKLSDWVDVKGEPQTDGSLLATSGMIFVNIARRDGAVESISGTGVSIRDSRGDVQHLEFSHVIEFVDSLNGSPLDKGWADIPVGTQVGAVGVLLPGGTLRATKVWK